MKKVFITAAIIGALGFAGIQAASAHSGFNNSGSGYCGNYNDNEQTRAYTEEDAKAFEKFQADTEATRKEIYVKSSELNALYRQDNPDEKKVAKLTGEIYDLQTQMQAKASTSGLDKRFGHGPGMMWGGGGRGWGHMMDW